MSYKPSAAVVDFETGLTGGESSIEFYRHDFRVLTAAFAWFREDGSIGSVVKSGESDIRAFLERCRGSDLICHNHQFEYGVALHRFPGCEDMFTIDTMRLCQMADNGGSEFEYNDDSVDAILEGLEGIERKTGLSLEAAISRFLPTKYHGHKKRFYDLIASRGGSKKDFNLLTADELIEYNKLDAENTLRLYQRLTEDLAAKGIDWGLDHRLYLSTSRLCAKSKSYGIAVDSAALAKHLSVKRAEMETIAARFIEYHKDAIRRVEVLLLDREMKKSKTPAAIDRLKADPPRFNTRSTQQLEMLFCLVLGMKPKFFTQTGKPSFGRKLLGQWGEGGLLLAKQRSILIEIKQGEALEELSEYDGRWHIEIKVAACRSGRLAGGSYE